MTWLRGQWDRVAAVVALVLGGIVLLVGWLGVSDEVYPAAQLPYLISGGLGGLFLLGVGSTFWLSADLRDEWRELRRIRGLLEQSVASDHHVVTTRGAHPEVTSENGVHSRAGVG